MKKSSFGILRLLLGAAASVLMPVDAMAAPAKLPEGLSLEGQSLAGLTSEEAKKKADDYAATMAGQTVTLNLKGVPLSTTADKLGFQWNNKSQVEEAICQYEDSNLLKRYMMAVDLEEAPMEIRIETSLEKSAIDSFVLKVCSGTEEESRDAVIIRENGEFHITPELAGMQVNLEATSLALSEAAKAGLKEAVIADAVVEESLPRITAADLATIQDVLGTFSTDFSSSGSARSTNLSVGAGKINGHVLMPGETLSGYECLQPFTAANGYRAAAAYENGQVVDSIGGGVCQIATTLYNAALLAELTITQRQNHSMCVGYVKPSQDAAIAGTYKDIKVTNPYETPIYVEGYTKGRTLVFTIYGKETRPANRKIQFLSETLSVIDPGAPREVPNAALAPGSRKQVQSAHRGIRSRLWKVVTVDGVEQERILLSTDTYLASPAIVQVGPLIPAAIPLPAPETIPETVPESLLQGGASQNLPTEPSAEQMPAESAAPQLPAETGQASLPEVTVPQTEPEETTMPQQVLPVQPTQPSVILPAEPSVPATGP